MIDRRTLVVGAALAGIAGPVIAATSGPRTIRLETATILDLDAAMAAGALTAERLVGLHLARIRRYDPVTRAIITLNPAALDIARALDAERRAHGARSPMHGVPVVLKDNIDTVDMATTGGSFVLAGSRPGADAAVVQRLRDAGAIILAKTNLSEFAAGPPFSSVHGQTYNPYNHAYTAGGSSSGSGAAIAAGYATLALGTDTGGSVRGPSTINGIVGLKPTAGLLSMAGIMPLSLTFDTAGPMARSVADVAVALGIMAGPGGERDYSRFLDAGALAGARLGLVRTFTGNDADYDRAIEQAAVSIRAAGGTVIDVRFPDWMMAVKGEFYTTVRWPEFRPQIDAYLARLGPGYPHDLAELARRSNALVVPNASGFVRNDARWALFATEMASGPVDDPVTRNIRERGLPLIRHALEAMLDRDRLDGFIYLTTSIRPPLVEEPAANDTAAAFGSTSWATQFASLAGLPDLVVPCGFTHDGLPIGLSIMGRAFSEPRLLALGHAFERRVMARRPPPAMPPLAGETISFRVGRA